MAEMNQEHLKILAEVKKWELSHLDLVQSVQCVTPLEALAAMQRLQEQIDTLQTKYDLIHSHTNFCNCDDPQHGDDKCLRCGRLFDPEQA